MASVRMDLPELAVQVGTGDEISVFVEGHAVGATGPLQEEGDLTRSGIPSVNPVVGLVGEEHVPVPVDGGALGEAVPRAQGRQLSVLTRRDEAEGIEEVACPRLLARRRSARLALI